MKLFSIIIFIIFTPIQFVAQNSRVGIELKILMQNTTVSSHIDLLISYRNSTTDSVYIYKTLMLGNLNNPYCNINIEMERLENGKFKKYKSLSDRHYMSSITNQDSLYYSTFQKLAPKQKLNLKLNLVSIYSNFIKGKYRVKINLLKIPDDINVPYEMSYMESKYLYFKTRKVIK